MNNTIKFSVDSKNSGKRLDIFLSDIYKKRFFSFFDVGGDNIDLYLFLSSKLNEFNDEKLKIFIISFLPLVSLTPKAKAICL